jgi:hypothetical protein
MQNKTVAWFGDAFDQLHPSLRELHSKGGRLQGSVDIRYGKGISGLIGKRLAAKMKIPVAGTHQLSVDISHDDNGLHWARCFNQQVTVASLFKPFGQLGNGGYWIETTGPLSMKLTVDIIDGGWHWRCLSVRFGGIPVPLWLIPKTTAYKVIEDQRYRFHVEFTLPLLGTLVCYRGLLDVA